MTRSDHSRDALNHATGSAAREARAGAGGRIVGYGMAGGGAHAGSGAPLPGRAAGYGQAPAAVDGPYGQMAADPYGQAQQAHARQARHAAPGAVPSAAPYGYQQPVAAPGQYVPPATSIPQQAPKKKRRAAFWVGLIVLLLCIALAAFLVLNLMGGTSKRQGSLGQLDGKTDAEIQAELDRVVDEGMFNISIAASTLFENGSAPGELRIENVPGNRYLMKVDIVRDDTGEKIYETDLIEPNHHIQSDTLDVSLPAGLYDCTAIFEAYDPQTEEAIGQAAANIVIQVAS